tara:strand:+ start:2469 stop:2684 length:216 start_codon:yes stop_codon:yes gene_type:complete
MFSQVRSLELGSNTSEEEKSQQHTLALLVTFTDHALQSSFLKSNERADFLAFAEPFVDEWFIFDFVSGGLM